MDLDYYSNSYINNQMIVTGKHTAHPDLCKKKKKNRAPYDAVMEC